jgi:hypothetical protein
LISLFKSNRALLFMFGNYATFYARFPNAYLRSISNLRTKYVPSPNSKIPLVQSRQYRMRKPTHQAAFFRLDLFYYMASGNCHIGYLSNNPSNPYVLRPVITFLFLSID